MKAKTIFSSKEEAEAYFNYVSFVFDYQSKTRIHAQYFHSRKQAMEKGKGVVMTRKQLAKYLSENPQIDTVL